MTNLLDNHKNLKITHLKNLSDFLVILNVEDTSLTGTSTHFNFPIQVRASSDTNKFLFSFSYFSPIALQFTMQLAHILSSDFLGFSRIPISSLQRVVIPMVVDFFCCWGGTCHDTQEGFCSTWATGYRCLPSLLPSFSMIACWWLGTSMALLFHGIFHSDIDQFLWSKCAVLVEAGSCLFLSPFWSLDGW